MDSTASRGPPVPTGIAMVLRKNQFKRLHLVVGLPHHEADEALHAGADQEAIDVRHVVRHQQRGAAEGHVLLADDADAEDGVGEQPEHEADQVIGDDGHDVDGDQRGWRNAEDKHDARRR